MNNPGDFAVCNSYPKDWGGKFLSWAIRFFGGANLTHTLAFLGRETNGTHTDELVFEADLLVKRTAVGNTSVVTWFHWRDEIQAAAAEAVWQIKQEHDGELYGMAQLPWFIWLWLVEKLHLPKRWAIHNVFHSGDICTGIVYLILERTVSVLSITNPGLANLIHPLIQRDGRDYRSQRPVDIRNIGYILEAAGYVTSENTQLVQVKL